MILPILLPPRHLRASGPPQGLVLDSPYAPVNRTEQGTELSADRYAEDEADIGPETSGLVINADMVSDCRNGTDVPELPDGQLCEISISHDGDLATAVALVPYMELKILSAK
jgi:holo-[acyl-carrier protein] synthase